MKDPRAEPTNHYETYECPYCNHEQEYEEEAETEVVDEVVECTNCSMKFLGNRRITVKHTSQPDCSLNGIDHSWVKEYDWLVCSSCSTTIYSNDVLFDQAVMQMNMRSK